MITMRRIEAPESIMVDFNEYVPLTITWSGASRVLEPPTYVELQDRSGYLEFKFDPSTRILIEVVLAAAPGVRVQQVALSPESLEDTGLMPFLDSSGLGPDIEGPLVIKAYSDYLYASFGSDVDRWVRSGQVLFGLGDQQTLTAICAEWTDSERDAVLASRRTSEGGSV